MRCETLFIVPVWLVWACGVWAGLSIVNAALELYLNAKKRELERARGQG